MAFMVNFLKNVSSAFFEFQKSYPEFRSTLGLSAYNFFCVGVGNWNNLKLDYSNHVLSLAFVTNLLSMSSAWVGRLVKPVMVWAGLATETNNRWSPQTLPSGREGWQRKRFMSLKENKRLQLNINNELIKKTNNIKKRK